MHWLICGNLVTYNLQFQYIRFVMILGNYKIKSDLSDSFWIWSDLYFDKWVNAVYFPVLTELKHYFWTMFKISSCVLYLFSNLVNLGTLKLQKHAFSQSSGLSRLLIPEHYISTKFSRKRSTYFLDLRSK